MAPPSSKPKSRKSEYQAIAKQWLNAKQATEARDAEAVKQGLPTEKEKLAIQEQQVQ